MAIYDNLPFTDFHELNADWLLKQMKATKAKVDSLQEQINQFNEDYAALAALFTISGNDASIPGTMTANGFIGNLTGNATTATNATYADTANSATNAGHAATADSATSATNAANATNATNATNAAVLNGNNDLGTDPDLMYEAGKMKIYYGPGFTSHYPTSCNEEPFLLFTTDRGLWRLQVAIFPQASLDMYFRIYTHANWGYWYKLDKTQAQ